MSEKNYCECLYLPVRCDCNGAKVIEKELE